MQTTKETGSMMQCPCGMVGRGVERDAPETFRDRTFLIVSKDASSVVHEARFMWFERDRRSTGECHGKV